MTDFKNHSENTYLLITSNTYLFKVNNKSTRKRNMKYEICSKLTRQIPEHTFRLKKTIKTLLSLTLNIFLTFFIVSIVELAHHFTC